MRTLFRPLKQDENSGKDKVGKGTGKPAKRCIWERPERGDECDLSGIGR